MIGDGFAKHEGLLRKGLNQLGQATTDNQVAQLLGFGDQLLRWNQVYNLTAIRNSADALTHHLLDCIAVASPLQEYLTQHLPGHSAGASILDVGSGGGLPGVVLAILNPSWAVTCVDAVAKKTAFVSQAAGTLRLPNLSAVHTRLLPEGGAKGLPLGDAQQGFDLVVSRAFASLADMTTLTRFHVKHADTSRWVAMKGKHPDAEIAELPTHAQLEKTQKLIVPGLNEERCLLWLRPVR